MIESGISPHLDYFLIAAIVAGLVSFYQGFSLLARLKKGRLIAATRKTINLIFFLAISGLASLIILTTRGYEALTHEQSVAVIQITPLSEQNFVAQIEFADGRSETYHLQGDEIMFEANILKWKAWTNLFGFTTAYRLDRVRGRYQTLQDEQNRSPSVYSIRGSDHSDLADWRKNYQVLSYILDVEHGSASYVSARENKTLELMVTNSGLMLREIVK